MCGRFVLFTTGERLLDAVGTLPGVTEVRAPRDTPPARYNIAPTQIAPVVRLGGEANSEALVEPARWGLLPHWKRDEKGPTLFNARSETVAEKPSFRDAFAKRRCVIPMDGYYEWHEKVPHFISRDDGGLLWAAGLWDTGLDQLSCTIVTTASAGPLEWLHDRMPLLLDAASAAAWCTGSAGSATEMLAPAAPTLRAHLQVRPVRRDVGNVSNDFPGLLDAVEAE